MASERDILARLPAAPDPCPNARQAAIAEAVQRFEKKTRARPQGFAHDLRLMQQTASSTPPSRRRSVMPRARHVIAASLVVLIAGSAIGLYVQRASDEWLHASQPPTVIASGPTKVISPIQDRFEQHPTRGP